ncbi:MAG: hypothetical protein LBK43_02320, partial [Treponema sp.]|nr:hypothetical protein [Treponema sp.]
MHTQVIKPSWAVVSLAAVFLFSCTSQPVLKVGENLPAPASLLPLVSGWYLYDFERTFKGIEDEYNFIQSTGMQMVEEITVRQRGTLTYCEDGVLHDPVLDIYLSVAETGDIRSINSPGISGSLSKNGAFFWSGLTEQNGRLNHVAVTGTLTPIPPSARGDSRYDGLYHLTDTGTGREQLALVKDGFYTWSYIDGEDTGFTP